jgi:predicted nucleic acid-binding protein
MSAFVDTNILIRHLTGDPPAMAARATAYLENESDLLLTDLIVAETVYVLESFYEAPRERVAEALLLRTLEIYETDGVHFADSYLVACAETTGVNRVASFDRSIDRVGTVERVEPGT